MENNEIYNFFKARKHTFDETPGNALWARIESGLNTPVTPSGSGFSFKTLLFLATAIGVVGIAGAVVLNNDNAIEKPLEPARVNEHGKIEAKPVVVPEVVKAPDIVITAEASPITITEPEITATAKDTVKKKKTYLAFQKINGKTTDISKDSIPFDINNVETTVRGTNGRVAVDTKEKLTPSQFKLLIEKVLAENEQAIGTMVTIKAPGHKVFRHIVKTKDNTYPARQTRDKNTLKTEATVKNTNNKAGVFEKVLISNDSLSFVRDSPVIEPEYIDFKLVEPGKE